MMPTIESTTLTIADWAPRTDSGPLKGIASVVIPTGYGAMTVHSIAIFEGGNGRRWISMPSKKITTDTGDIAKFAHVEFTDREQYKAFSHAVFRALDEAGLLDRDGG